MTKSRDCNFRDFLTESFKNLHTSKDKEPYAQEVYDLLKESYAGVGGLRGSGFNTPQDMINNIPFWKLAYSEGELVAVVMYKENKGRKLVALGSSGTPQAKKYVLNILKIEFTRSYSEISGPLLAYISKRIPEVLNKYRIKSQEVQDIIGKEIEPIDEYYYIRKIGNNKLKKIMLGTIHK